MLEFQMTTDDVERAAELIVRPLERRLKTQEMLDIFRNSEFKKHIARAVEDWFAKDEASRHDPLDEYKPMARIAPMPEKEFDARLTQLENPRKSSKKPLK